VDSLRSKDIDLLERAFRFYYVNRVAYNGVGSFSCIVNYVRRGMSKPISDMLSSISHLDKVHNRLSSVIIENKDALGIIDKFDKSNVLFYLDPPYHHSTRTIARYDIDMTNKQQGDLIKKLIDMKKARVLLSGYRCELYDQLTDNGWERIDFGVKTQSGKRESRDKVESLWRNY
jgi:DNA adenine methylase